MTGAGCWGRRSKATKRSQTPTLWCFQPRPKSGGARSIRARAGLNGWECPLQQIKPGTSGIPYDCHWNRSIAFCWFFRGSLLLLIKSTELKHCKPQCGRVYTYINDFRSWNVQLKRCLKPSYLLTTTCVANNDRKHTLTYLILLTTLLGSRLFLFANEKIDFRTIMWLAHGLLVS